MMKSVLHLAGLLALAAAAAEPLKDLGTVLAENPDLTTYNSLIKKNPEILLQLPNFSGVTIVAPSNSAFENIPYTALNGIWDADNKNITIPLLQYHILQGTVLTSNLQLGPTFVRPTLLADPAYANVTNGQNVLINVQPGGDTVLTTSLGTRCTITDPDIPFQGGVVQVVDNLLIPPARLNLTAQTFKLESFLGLLWQTGLMPAVQDDRRDITVFAPLDKALALVGGSLAALDAKQLARVAAYHVVPGKVLVSSSLLGNASLPTLASDGADALSVRQFGNNVYINSAPIVQPDILLANGILHIIADVLNPLAAHVLPNATAISQTPVFPESTSRNPFTSALPCTTNCPVPTATLARANVTTTASSTSRHTTGGAAHQAMATAHVVMGAALGVLAML